MKKTDLVIFMGQSNMAGRGNAEEAVKCEEHMGCEFRAVSDPTKLYPIAEPFGYNENRSDGINDGARKKGSLVSDFIKEYFHKTGRFVVAVSASVGGTSSAKWAECYVEDAASRLRAAKAYLDSHGFVTEHIFMLWCQGETDGDKGTSEEEYRANFQTVFSVMKQAGVQTCFLIQIGHFNYPEYPEGPGGLDGRLLDERYGVIRSVQEKICKEEEAVIFAASFSGYLADMKDMFHYKQSAYNEVGALAAATAAGIFRHSDETTGILKNSF